jgi:hypothetical protein
MTWYVNCQGIEVKKQWILVDQNHICMWPFKDVFHRLIFNISA